MRCLLYHLAIYRSPVDQDSNLNYEVTYILTILIFAPAVRIELTQPVLETSSPALVHSHAFYILCQR